MLKSTIKKEVIDSKNLVRKCEKCNQPTLLLTQEITGKFTYNVVLKTDLGVIAERWSCQNCDNYFEVSLEKPNPAKVWTVMGLIPGIIGFIGVTGMAVTFLNGNSTAEKTIASFDFIYCLIMLIVGSIATFYGIRKQNIMKRNSVVDAIPPPMAERKQNEPLSRRARLCKCGSSMNCKSELKKTFNMIPMGTIYTFACTSNNYIKQNLNLTCENKITIESLWRSFIFLVFSFLLILILKFTFDNGINSAVGWILFSVTLLAALVIIVIRFWRLLLYFKYKRIK